MSDPELATKAPESDAMETGAGVGEHCVTDRPNPDDRQPSGEMTKFGDIDVYVSKPGDYPNSPAKLLLLLTPGTGVHSTNNQIQADIFASEGFVVIMPDQFRGDAAPNSKAIPAEEHPSILEQVKLRAAETAKSFLVDMWLARQTPEKVIPILLKVIEAVKDEYADAIAHGEGIYSVGYCFGGKYVIMLAGEHPDTVVAGQPQGDEEVGMVKKGPLIKAGAVAHATLVTREDFKAVQAPLALACVENDPLFPEEILQEGRKQFAASNIKHDIQVYSGVPHGFAVYGDYDSPAIKEAQAAAFQQILTWLKSH
ncbi:hypothetical protein A1O3_02637 [Capronia epimyces CBS 606.96]|uniref:Dienelactone hydrolase domain-containing protein n=1 Tax=Capronia epimyces CBS 606.96 TaxID=1182542 RepID=W9YIR6_9EURO|nr:uncharacterized protein A1O3_02637 [Capronia epimyces CBS 606.96]EXJ89570.1 hypothetical protein A1O3_02637 [Capronia epimyces CBS 606.96]